MVYSFYDPEARGASLGTYMILEHIAYARQLGCPTSISATGSPARRKMSYKMRFQPQEQLGPNGWVRK